MRDWDIQAPGASETARKEVEEVLERSGTKLWTVVNNAALLVMAKVEWQTERIIQSQLDVSHGQSVL